MREKQKKMDKEINLKGKKGITLIALVITIIVLLILAGVTIATLTGDNGLLQKAGETKNTTKDVEIEEEIRLAWNKVYLDDTMNNYTAEQKANALKLELENNKPGEIATVDVNNDKFNINYRKKNIILDISTGIIKEFVASNMNINFENLEYVKKNISISTVGTFWNTDWSAMQETQGKKLLEIKLTTATPGTLTFRGYDNPIDRTLTYSALQQEAITADKEGYDIFVLNLLAGENTYKLDGTDTHVTIVNQNAINSCPASIGVTKPGDTGLFKYQNNGNLPNLDGPTFVYSGNTAFNKRQVLGFTLNVSEQWWK